MEKYFYRNKNDLVEYEHADENVFTDILFYGEGSNQIFQWVKEAQKGFNEYWRFFAIVFGLKFENGFHDSDSMEWESAFGTKVSSIHYLDADMLSNDSCMVYFDSETFPANLLIRIAQLFPQIQAEGGFDYRGERFDWFYSDFQIIDGLFSYTSRRYGEREGRIATAKLTSFDMSVTLNDSKKMESIAKALQEIAEIGYFTAQSVLRGRQEIHIEDYSIDKKIVKDYKAKLEKEGCSVVVKEDPDPASVPAYTRWVGRKEGQFKIGNCGNKWIVPVSPKTPVSDKKTNAKKEFKVGEIGPAGGYVFYDKGEYSEGWRYLEAAPADLVFGGEFDQPSLDYSVRYKQFKMCFGEYCLPSSDINLAIADGKTNTKIGRTQTELGTGKHNTQFLLSAMEDRAVCSLGLQCYIETGVYAARMSDLLKDETSGLVFDDWFLPSLDELRLMREHLFMSDIGDFAEGVYWSSSEDKENPEKAFCVFFVKEIEKYNWNRGYRSKLNMDYHGISRSEKCHVRPIRAF